MWEMLTRLITDSMSTMDEEITPNFEYLRGVLVYGVKNWAMIVAPLLAVAITVPLLSGAVQTKGLFTMKPLKPKFSKLNPITGAKRLFSMQTFVNVIKGVIVIGVMSIIIFNRIRDNISDYQKMPDMEPEQSAVYIAQTIFSIVMLMFMIIVFVSVGDYIFQWWQYEKKLKMSKQEVKDEYKQIEGDPQIKSKIKQKQREISQQRMMEQVPTSDVVVRNPMHYAIAISYDRENTLLAPKVVAKGKDALALKIISIAEDNDVYVTENRPLARELYDTVEVGQEIPPSLYNAIAVILTDMYTAKGITIDK